MAIPAPECRVPPFPIPDQGITFVHCTPDNPAEACISVTGLTLLAAWVEAVEDWRKSVMECPGVEVVTP